MASELSAVNVTACGVLCKENDDGDALKPEGRPETVTETAPLKPFLGTTETWTAEVVPGAIEGADGVTDMAKEGGGGGIDKPLPPPPQPYRAKENPSPSTRKKYLVFNRLKVSLRSLMIIPYRHLQPVLARVV